MYFSAEDSITFTDELSSASHGLVAPPDSAEELLASVKLLMSENLVRQVGASYHFDINSKDGGHRRYYVDLSQGNCTEDCHPSSCEFEHNEISFC